ncbi:hypothetical protein FRB94_010584 [Tulasnella sp. JGI-2019a]|nr:hypothetical protein FRB94_010584 [Tulasnella sp. JGI-2019a]KAG9039111.1 hypothetical protein FRB95_012822 [Tulasnella sp. JGI-2019a]
MLNLPPRPPAELELVEGSASTTRLHRIKPMPQGAQRRRIKIAVAGSGLAGLTAAYLLARQNEKLQHVTIEVHLFEKSTTLGMDSQSVSVPLDNGEKLRVDVPMRSFQGGYYRQLIALYNHLDIKLKCVDFTYSFSHLRKLVTSNETPSMGTFFIYNGQNGKRGLGLPSQYLWYYPHGKPIRAALQDFASTKLFPLMRFLWVTLTFFACYVRFVLISTPAWRLSFWGSPTGETLREWGERTRPRDIVSRCLGFDASWDDFVRTVVFLLFSGMCTSSDVDVWAHPVEEILDYTWSTLFANHFVVADGVQDVVRRLSSHLDPESVHLSSPITQMLPDPTNPGMITVVCPNTQIQGFSHVIFATQATHAVPILSTYLEHLSPTSKLWSDTDRIIRCLETFEYRQNIVVTHTDDRLLPSDTRDRRDLNLVRFQPSRDWTGPTSPFPGKSHICMPPTFTMATHSIKSETSSQCIYQSTNPIIAPSTDKVLSVAHLDRAILTVQSQSAVRELTMDDPERAAWWALLRGRPKAKVLGALQGGGRRRDMGSDRTSPGIWMCGSYAYEGIPLLEGCVASARMVVGQGVMRAEGLDAWDVLV